MYLKTLAGATPPIDLGPLFEYYSITLGNHQQQTSHYRSRGLTGYPTHELGHMLKANHRRTRLPELSKHGSTELRL